MGNWCLDGVVFSDFEIIQGKEHLPVGIWLWILISDYGFNLICSVETSLFTLLKNAPPPPAASTPDTNVLAVNATWHAVFHLVLTACPPNGNVSSQGAPSCALA